VPSFSPNSSPASLIRSEFEARGNQLISNLNALGTEILDAASLSPLVPKADIADLTITIRKMKAALRFREYAYYSSYVVHEEDRVFGIQPESSQERDVSPEYAEGEFSSGMKCLVEIANDLVDPQTSTPASGPMPGMMPLIFVSCGQSTSAERQLGKAIAKLVEEQTGCSAYFAENQTSLEGVTENILKRLNNAGAFIAIMHPRGDVSNPKDPARSAWSRGSVWVEQEIAIAAFISQALDRPLQVRFYVHESIRREGLRDKLHLNPVQFHDDSEILDDLISFLPGWRALGRQLRKERLSLKANIEHQRVAIPGGSDDERYRLVVSIENDGEEDATDFRLDVDFPTAFIDEGGHALRVPSVLPGFERFQVTNVKRGVEHFYPGDKLNDLISFHYVLRGKMKRENPEQLQARITATISSGNMKPRRTEKTIAELAN
jgi:hypothetical protein